MKKTELVTSAGLAWRNVWRNKRRTILTLLTILVGSAMIIFMNAFAKGGHDQMIQDSVSQNVGHLQIHEKGYWENQTIDYAFIPDQNLINSLSELKKNGTIEGYSRRINADALLSCNNNSAGALIQGIDPDEEKYVSNIKSSIIQGRYLINESGNEIVIGEILASNLGAVPGMTVTILSQGFDGSIAADRLTVAGIFKSNNPEYDQGLAIIPIKRANDTFYMNDYIQAITIRCSNIDNVSRVKDILKKNNSNTDLEVMDWSELMPELVQFIVMDDFSAYIFDAILFMIVAFGILNTIQMSVFERTRELGIMLAIGTKPAEIISMILFESLYISILGLILGVLLGAGLSYYFQVNPLDLTDYSKEFSVWGVNTVQYPANASRLNIAVTAIVTLLLSLTFSVFPARRAARLKPIDAIRQL